MSLTRVDFLGPSRALATNIPTAVMTATRTNRKIGVNSLPIASDTVPSQEEPAYL